MNEELKNEVIESLNMLEILKDELCDSAKIFGSLAEVYDGAERAKYTAETVALYSLINGIAKQLCVFQAHTRHFKREFFTVEVTA